MPSAFMSGFEWRSTGGCLINFLGRVSFTARIYKHVQILVVSYIALDMFCLLSCSGKVPSFPKEARTFQAYLKGSFLFIECSR